MARKSSSPKPAVKPQKIPKTAEAYAHPDQMVLMRPEAGTQPSFRKKKPPVTYRYDTRGPALDRICNAWSAVSPRTG